MYIDYFARLEQAMLAKDWEAGYSVFLELRQLREGVTGEAEAHVEALPPFLRRYSSLGILTCGLSRGVELLEKMKR